VRSGRFAVLVAVLVALLATLSTAPVAADPDTQAKLRKLTGEAAALSKLYRGTIESLEDTRLAARKASARAASLKDDLARAQADVGQIIQTAYMTGPLGSGQLFGMGGDADSALGSAAAMTYLADERTNRLTRVKAMIANADLANQEAKEKVDALEKSIAKMKAKRATVEKLLAKYGFQTPVGGAGLTPRMISVRDEVLRNFPMPFSYGCLRAGDPGEHGKGRACDFMMSSGGRPASGDGADRGDALAQWLIANGNRLGVMYIIWKQRYYDIRTGGGWDPMSDRGGTTANHWDHVHVSVF